MWMQQLRDFDNRIADFRTWYFEFTEAERREVRAYLEDLIACEERGHNYSIEIRAISRLDTVGEDGEVTGWLDAQFSPATMVRAIEAWDRGDAYAPSSIRP